MSKEIDVSENGNNNRRGRNYALGAVLFAMVGLFYLITVIRMGGH